MNTPAAIRAYLVDDEPLAIDRLQRLLSSFPSVTVVGAATDSDEAIRALTHELNGSVDVLFLDIQMPGKNGFELLASLDKQPFIIFTTAFDEYALRAFQVNSIDYLVKPIESEQLQRAMTKLEKMRPVFSSSWQNDPQLQTLFREMSSLLHGEHTDAPRRIATRIGDRITFLDLSTISHFLAKDKLTYAIVQGRQHVIDLTITELEEKLALQNFLRIHRAVLVSLDWILEVNTWFAGKLSVTLRDQPHTQLTVARDRVQIFRSRMMI